MLLSLSWFGLTLTTFGANWNCDNSQFFCFQWHCEPCDSGNVSLFVFWKKSQTCCLCSPFPKCFRWCESLAERGSIAWKCLVNALQHSAHVKWQHNINKHFYYLFIFLHLLEISVEWAKLEPNLLRPAEQQSLAENKEDASVRVNATFGESFHMAALILFSKPSVKWKGKTRAPFLSKIYFNQLHWNAADDVNLNFWRRYVTPARLRNPFWYPD